MTSGVLPPRVVPATNRLRAFVRRVGFAPPLLLLAFLAPLPAGTEGHIAGLPSLCGFHNLTGLPCPGCGITRAVVCLAHGRILEAVVYHPLSPLVFAALVFVTVSRLVEMARPGWGMRPLPPRLLAAGAWVLLVLLGAVWVLRLTGQLPAPP
jgi:hypothetical protein